MRWQVIYRRWRLGLPFIKGVLLVATCFCLVSLAAAGWPRLSLPVAAVPVFTDGGQGFTGQGLFRRVLELYEVDFVQVFSQGLPLSSRYRPAEIGHTAGASDLFPWLSQSSSKLKLSLQPLGLVQNELGWFQLAARGGDRFHEPPRLETAPVNPNGPQVVSPQPLPQPLQPVLKPEGPARVAVYHTHTSEDYVPTAGSTHTYGREAGIVAVGRELVQQLEEKHGIPCIHDITLHDADVFREAYLRSADTVARLLKEQPKLQVILDIHRDAPNKDSVKSRTMTTTEIHGQQVGRIYIIVGTDRLGLAHPSWPENHAFALELQGQLEALYPGLSRGIKIDTARFNQQLHPRLILIEIGGDQNSLEEAMLAADYLADALAAWFQSQPGS
ncbi:MAG TPA: stage II sporulation protein P [Firmicutes bacterium]|nr:stage II sporulation protein P [Bacillota bacterium]